MKIKNGKAEKLPVDQVQHLGKDKKPKCSTTAGNCYEYTTADGMDDDAITSPVRYVGLRHQGFDFIVEMGHDGLVQLKYPGRARSPNDLSQKFTHVDEAVKFLKSYDIKVNSTNKDKVKK